MSLVWEMELPTSEKMVLLVIADHADDGGGNAWPSVATIARKSSLSERQAQRLIKNLTNLGLVTVESQAGGTREMRDDRRPNRYTLHLDGVTSTSPGAVVRGDMGDANGVTWVSPKPSIEPSNSYLSVPDRFDEFWKTYPSRKAKGAAVRAWKTALKKADADTLIAAAEAYARDPKRDPEFTAHASTWLNQERWLDEVETPKQSGPVTVMDQYADEPCEHGEPRGPQWCAFCRSEGLRGMEGP
jgi:hypothetical protein